MIGAPLSFVWYYWKPNHIFKISDLENATLIQILFVNLIFQAIFGTIICNVGRNFVIRTPFFSEELFNRSVTVMLFLPASLEMFGIRYEHSTVISLIPAILMSLFILSKVSTFNFLLKHCAIPKPKYNVKILFLKMAN